MLLVERHHLSSFGSVVLGHADDIWMVAKQTVEASMMDGFFKATDSEGSLLTALKWKGGVLEVDVVSPLCAFRWLQQLLVQGCCLKKQGV